MKYLLLTILLIELLLITGCVSENKNILNTTQTLCEKKCNDICYDPNKQMCCNGYLYEGNWEKFDFGGGCCGGVIIRSYENKSCCNGIPYNFKTHSCENGIIYNFKTQNVCDGIVYNISSHYCCFGKIIEGATYSTCGFSCYNYLSQHCCNGVVEEGGGPWKSCGNLCYNTRTQSCCNGIIYRGSMRCCERYQLQICPEGMACCSTRTGPKCYNPEVQQCVPTL
jgi:hypothetical protein